MVAELLLWVTVVTAVTVGAWLVRHYVFTAPIARTKIWNLQTVAWYVGPRKDLDRTVPYVIVAYDRVDARIQVETQNNVIQIGRSIVVPLRHLQRERPLDVAVGHVDSRSLNTSG